MHVDENTPQQCFPFFILEMRKKWRISEVGMIKIDEPNEAKCYAKGKNCEQAERLVYIFIIYIRVHEKMDRVRRKREKQTNGSPKLIIMFSSRPFRAIPHHHIFLSTHRPLSRWTREARDAKRQIYALIIYGAFNYNAGKRDEIILASAFVVVEAIISDDAATTVKKSQLCIKINCLHILNFICIT